jgi:hypothetical protein
MPLKRLTPLVNRHDLGVLRLWRDELAEVVKLIQQLDDVELRIEADGYQLDDVDTDLPQIGKLRIEEFSVTATRPTYTYKGGAMHAGEGKYINVRLSKNGSYVEVTDPEPDMRGVVSDIQTLIAKCRRLPLWSRPLIENASTGTVSSSTTTTRVVAARSAQDIPTLAVILTLVSFIASGLAWISVGQHVSHMNVPIIKWPASLITGIIAIVIFIPSAFILSRSRTIIFTGTRAQAPTWWQRHRADVGINIIVGLLLYLLGLLTAHI